MKNLIGWILTTFLASLIGLGLINTAWAVEHDFEKIKKNLKIACPVKYKMPGT